jgi:hypothetical protein
MLFHSDLYVVNWNSFLLLFQMSRELAIMMIKFSFLLLQIHHMLWTRFCKTDICFCTTVSFFFNMSLLPQAVRRRFDKRIYIPLPDMKARQHMFKVLKNLSNLTIFILMVKTSNPCAVKRDLNDWSIIKELALDKRE